MTKCPKCGTEPRVKNIIGDENTPYTCVICHTSWTQWQQELIEKQAEEIARLKADFTNTNLQLAGYRDQWKHAEEIIDRLKQGLRKIGQLADSADAAALPKNALRNIWAWVVKMLHPPADEPKEKGGEG